MADLETNSMVSDRLKVVGAALVGAVVGLAATAAALGSVAFGIFGAVATAVAMSIATLAQSELAEA